jgi:Lrp/AsnC family transcriptional regulator
LEKILLDKIDRGILESLQQDCTRPIADIAQAIGLSATPCWKRIKRMEDAGMLERRVAIVNRHKVGLPVTVFVSIRMGQHDERTLAQFAAAVAALPEVQEFHRMSGDVDYLLKVVTTSIEGYDRFYKKLIQRTQLAGVSSAFSMEQMKSTTALPLELVGA